MRPRRQQIIRPERVRENILQLGLVHPWHGRVGDTTMTMAHSVFRHRMVPRSFAVRFARLQHKEQEDASPHPASRCGASLPPEAPAGTACNARTAPPLSRWRRGCAHPRGGQPVIAEEQGSR